MGTSYSVSSVPAPAELDFETDETGQHVPVAAHAPAPLVAVVEKPLEELVDQWTRTRSPEKRSRIEVRAPPPYFGALFVLLRRQHREFRSVGLASAFVVRAGLLRLERWPEVVALQELRLHALQRGMQSQWGRFAMENVPRFQFARAESQSQVSRKRISVFERSDERMCEMSDELGLAKGDVFKLAILAGFHASTVWVPTQGQFFQGIVADEVAVAKEYFPALIQHAAPHVT